MYSQPHTLGPLHLMRSSPDWYSVILEEDVGNITLLVETLRDYSLTGELCLTDVDCSEEPFARHQLEDPVDFKWDFMEGNKFGLEDKVS